MKRSLFATLFVCCFAASVSAEESRTAFLESNCQDCHTGDAAEAGFDATLLDQDLNDPETTARWIRVFDRVRTGEMPPQEYGQLDPDQAGQFLSETSDWIAGHQDESRRIHGRVQGRRLTNRQLERTLQDLLAIDRPLAEFLPAEPRSDGFKGIADAQAMSSHQLAGHLSVVDMALDAAFQRAAETQPLYRREYTAREMARRNNKQRNRDPEWLNGAAVVWNSTMPFYGRMASTVCQKNAWYRITLTASALHKPEDHGVWCTVRHGDCSAGSPLMTWVGAFETTDERRTVSFEAWIPAGERLEVRTNDATLPRAKFRGGQVDAGLGEPQGVPGIAMHGMIIEEIQPGGDATKARQQLFGDLPVVTTDDGEVAFDDEPSVQDLERQVQRFARLAFRRPVDASVVEPYQRSLQAALSKGATALEALRGAYRAMLCSPRFLYFTEPVGDLDDIAIANRLSYLICQTQPDADLKEVALTGRLTDRDVLIGQLERLMRTPRGKDFVANFTAEWLELDQINFTEPDARLYRDFDVVVQNSMLEETHAFVDKLIRDNAPIRELVDADYTYLNSRLARYYEVESKDGQPIEGDEIRLVSLPADSPRGGLLSHGSVLKVTANGTATSPVLRGVWLCDRVLGTPIPPPPENVPAIEPDIRGATTIRDMLTKHEADPNCAACHCKIDPPGFALEMFDAAGRYRENYLTSKKRKTKPVDASGTLNDGRSFEDFVGFRRAVADNARPMARNFVEKLVVFATGQSIQFADRDEVDSIVASAESSDYGMRDLLDATLTSPLFLKK